MQLKPNRQALTAASIYIVAAAGWNFFTALLLKHWVLSPLRRMQLDLIKDFGFEILMGGLLFVILRRLLGRWEKESEQREQAEVARRVSVDNLHRSEEQLRMVMEASADGFWDWNLETGIADLSPRFWEIIGYPPGEPVADIGFFKRLIHPADWPAVEEELNRHRAGKTAQAKAEYRLTTKSGTEIWAWVRGKVVARAADGTPLRMAGTISDITERKRAEKALRESELLMRSIMENSQEIIFVKDRECRFVFMNPAGYRLTGLSPEKLLGRSKADFHPNPVEAAQFMVDDRRVMESTKLETIEEELGAADGSRHVFLTTKVARLDSQGKVIGLIGVAHDITERKRAEKALAKSLSLLNATLESTADGILVIDRASKVVSYNNKFIEMWGISSDIAAMGERDRILALSLEKAKDSEAFLARVREIYNQPQSNSFDTFEMKDGRIFERYSQPQRLDGECVGRVWCFRDVTERKKAEAELAYERHLLRSLMENSTDHIYFKDTQSRYIKSSNAQARQFGASSADELVGKSDFDFFTPDRARTAFEGEQTIIRTGQPMIGIIEKETWKDGRADSWVLTTKMPLRNRAGEIIGTFGISKDITPIKEAQAKLEALHKQLVDASRQAGMAEVATSVLHNVGNVLNSVNVSTTLILENLRKSRLANLGRVATLINEHQNNLDNYFTSDPKGRQLPSYLTSLAERLMGEQAELLKEIELTRQHVEHIKEIVAMQQGYAKVSGVVEKAQVTDVVEDALRLTGGALLQHNVQVIRDYPAQAIEIFVERHKVLQVLVNLIRNSKHACDESGRKDKCLTLQVRNEIGRVQIAVIDNGVGIAPENMTRIFRHGFTTRKKGHGFGLHSGALAAKEMGGTLKAQSDGPGAGARFILELPLQPPAQTGGEPAKPS